MKYFIFKGDARMYPSVMMIIDNRGFYFKKGSCKKITVKDDTRFPFLIVLIPMIALTATSFPRPNSI